MIVADIAARVDQPLIDQAKAHNISGFVLYLTGPNALDRSHVDLIHRNGLDVAGVTEFQGTEGNNPAAAQNVAQTGVGAYFNAGGPPGGMLWLGLFDYDMRDPGLAQLSINRAAAVVHGAGLQLGVYGSAGIGKRTANWQGWWMTESEGFWENGNPPWPGATLVQRLPMLGPFDRNNVQRDYWGQFKGAPTPVPQPQPKKGKRMNIYELPNGGLFVSDLVQFRWLNGDDRVKAAEWMITSNGGDAKVNQIQHWQQMGVPADPGSASAVGVGFPASAS